MKNVLIRMKDILINLVYPPRCAVCDGVLFYPKARNCSTDGVCANCYGKLRYIREPICMKCGKEINDDEAEYCYDCENNQRSYIRGFPVFNYVPPVSEAVIAIKYHNRQEYAAFYGNEIVKVHGATFKRLGIEALVPVPVHENRLRKRGYNQAELIAEVISKGTGIRLDLNLIKRVSDTKPQKELDDVEREKNLHLAFARGDGVDTNRTVPESVLIVDDIYTTGATVEACTKVLLAMGVKRVYYTSICIGKV